MRVIHIVRQFSPSVGGLEEAVLNLARIQRKDFGMDARVVTLNRIFDHKETLPPTEHVAGIPVRRLSWRGSTRYPFAPAVLNRLQAADIVHVHAIDFFFDFLALTRPLHRRNMIASTHGGFFHTAKFATAKKLWFHTATRASILAYHRIVACSHSDAAMFKDLAGRRLAVIENGIDREKFVLASAPAPTRTIICFGRFAQHKRIAGLFPLLAQLRAQHPAWRLIVAGREADQSLAQLQTLAEAAGVAEMVRFVHGPDDAQLRALLGKASYFACLSSYEGFGLAAVEAMSAGLFPILSAIPPFERLVRDTRIGLLAEPTAPADIAAAVEASFLENSVAYARRRAQISDAVRRYDWAAVAAQYATIYDEVIDRKSSVGSGRRVGVDA